MSIIEQAESEMKLAKMGADDAAMVLQILHLFFDQWDSGGAVHVMAPVLQRLIAGKPLSPLTGEDSEWFKPMDDVECYQNQRCGTVFKERDADGSWITYDIARNPSPGRAVSESGHRWAQYRVSFPYMPGEMAVADPVVVI